MIASEPPPQLGMRIISPIGSDRFGVRRIDGQLDNHSVGICGVERRAVAMIEDEAVGLSIACGREPLLDLLLGLGIAFERDVMKRGGRHFRSEEFLILWLLELEEGSALPSQGAELVRLPNECRRSLHSLHVYVTENK